ncbi:DUF2147 domain-containing protein [Helicobacter didelphidarum]|uniref:DUF2147 domain-containing protein n=1 Tax=Helicobacter didelphidarum TaxID=2040648 RepID=A0A3D8IR63_9HELI|nr:DUF2147 domain-containing protein [Helicobacter didelphidarum]RDU67094.1 DUF2147 domain-containing protein [Helicobacter didelphidarum]
MLNFINKKIFFLYTWVLASSITYGIEGIYLTHKGTEGGQSIVEIFQYNNVYYIYGLKNLEADPLKDTCNKNADLRNRTSVGNVWAYGYKKNGKGHFVDGIIYNFNNCKFYYGKIIVKDHNTIEFVGALDKYYMLHRGYTWRLLDEKERLQYEQYRIPLTDLLKTAEDTMRSK